MLHAWQLGPRLSPLARCGFTPIRQASTQRHFGLLPWAKDHLWLWLHLRGILIANFDGGGSISSTSRPRQSEKCVQQVLQFEQGWHCLPLVWGSNCQVGLVDPFSHSIVTGTEYHNGKEINFHPCSWGALREKTGLSGKNSLSADPSTPSPPIWEHPICKTKLRFILHFRTKGTFSAFPKNDFIGEKWY